MKNIKILILSSLVVFFPYLNAYLTPEEEVEWTRLYVEAMTSEMKASLDEIFTEGPLRNLVFERKRLLFGDTKAKHNLVDVLHHLQTIGDEKKYNELQAKHGFPVHYSPTQTIEHSLKEAGLRVISNSGKNIIFTSDDPENLLSKHVVIIPAVRWPNKCQLLSRVARAEDIQQLGYNHIDVNYGHFIYIRPNPSVDAEAGILNDANCIVLMRKIEDGHRGWESDQIHTLWERSHITIDGAVDPHAVAMYRQGKQAIRRVGLL